ncbi:undecaprenyl-phosphate glucose phosphotransferase [Oscillibacter sp.]|uniref:undecaprenyl-phosphate glucose phosphotransferase n=1 Tax=Oscillibacter sp. TaxID=1945593 RepID=UPI0026022EFD|nr:undecaprenyl-phosphate glucose phosphotransferase [Oscillibacter sp.]MDD3346574.1 undecaprenyl-phosphate glucose phosphotransferase [Oscillibacter sp.]
MIRENQRLLNQLNVLTDGVLVFFSVLLAYWVRFHLFHGSASFAFSSYVWLGLCAVALCLGTYAVTGLYASYRTVRFHKEAQTLFLATVLDTLVLISALFVFRLTEMSRWLLVFFCVLAYALLVSKRALLRITLRHYRRLGYNQKHVLVVGCGEMAKAYVQKVREDRDLGFLVDGYVADKALLKDTARLGGYDQLEAILEERNPDEVILAMAPEEYALTGHIINLCEKTGTKLTLIPFYAAYMPSSPQVDNINGLPMINLRRIPLDNMANAFLKRAMDIAGSLTLIVLTSPLMLFAAVGVKLSSPGPVLFKQERVGRNKVPFQMYKFRSMRLNAAEKTGWSRNADTRKTPFGSLIRKCSIDELPQFFNVLKGDMSLVGPRPEVPFYVDQFKEEIPRYMVKHQVRPGITGWAQVNGYRGDTSIKKRIEYDLYYIENWNFFFDLKILLMTVTKSVNSEKIAH